MDLIRQASSSNVGNMFATQALMYPNTIALECNGEHRTYAELNERINRLANVMQDRGVGHGERVGLLARNCSEYVEVNLAAAKIGAITVALNWRLSRQELEHCIQLTSPKMLIVQSGFMEDLERLEIGPAYEAALADASPKNPLSEAGGEDGLIIIFTSGTTGLPKGALISHRAIIARTAIFSAEAGAPAKDTFVAWTPLFHMGANDFTFATLLRGGKVIVVDGYQPEKLANIVETEVVHYLTVIPGMILDFINVLKSNKIRPKNIGIIGAMADLVPRQQLSEITMLLQAPYLNTFGSTETGMPPATNNRIEIGEVPTSLSKLQNDLCEIRLVDENDNEVPDGEPGELAIRGPSLFSGYWNNNNANEEAIRNGWFHMGDVFRRNSDGTLDFVDRVKYMIKSGGENIYPAEIEQYILAHPAITEAAVVRMPDEKWGEVPVLFAASKDQNLTADHLIEACRDKLASYKLPKDVHFIDFNDFPRSSTGKILRNELERRLNQ